MCHGQHMEWFPITGVGQSITGSYAHSSANRGMTRYSIAQIKSHKIIEHHTKSMLKTYDQKIL